MKQDYICGVPFTSFEVQEKENFLCCASWLFKPIPKYKNVVESWNSIEANEIRESILDGSYKYCDDTQCPFLAQVEHKSKGKTGPLFLRNNLPKLLKDKIDLFKEGVLKPEIIQFSFDRTCNLQCPTCRVELITADSKQIKNIELTIKDIEKYYSSDITTLYITGSGDPFISVGFRNFLRNFDKKKYPNLVNIHLHTNATKWNKKMWNSMKNVHKYVRSCEISVDAATKNTYENITRLGGNWDELIDNLKFISKLPYLSRVKTSFVVQKSNYKEMKLFYNIMKKIFRNKVSVFYGKVNNWGTYTEKEFNDLAVWNNNHPLHLDFLSHVNETLPADRAWSNLQEFITEKKQLI